MYKEILNYQDKDLQIYRLNKENSETEYRKIIKDSGTSLKIIEDKLNKLGCESGKQISNFNHFTSNLQKINSEISAIEKDTNLTSEAKEKEISTYIDKVDKIQKNINILKSNIEKINKLYEDLRNQYTELAESYKSAKGKQSLLDADVQSKIEKLKGEMSEMEKTINPNVLKKYKDCKADAGLPVYVKLTENGACGGCMQKIATNEIDKLKQDKIVVCENCKRIIIDRE